MNFTHPGRKRIFGNNYAKHAELYSDLFRATERDRAIAPGCWAKALLGVGLSPPSQPRTSAIMRSERRHMGSVSEL